MMNTQELIISGVSLLVGSALGLLAYGLWARHKLKMSHRLPDRLPLTARKIVSRTEKDVWDWLRTSFPEHVVMVKVPLLRFTMLRDAVNATASEDAAARTHKQHARWLEFLNGIYTTFTISTKSGKVVGCVDLSGKALAEKGHELKETLLLDCGIAYLVVSALNLPTVASMRASFLGEIEVLPVADEVTRGGDSVFYADMNAFKKLEAR